MDVFNHSLIGVLSAAFIIKEFYDLTLSRVGVGSIRNESLVMANSVLHTRVISLFHRSQMQTTLLMKSDGIWYEPLYLRINYR